MPPPSGGSGARVAGMPHPAKANLGWIGEGWNIFSADIGGYLMLLVPLIVVYVVIMILSAITAGLGSILALALGPVVIATCGALVAKMRGGPTADFNSIIERSKAVLVPGIVYSLIASIAISCAGMLCVIPAFLVFPAAYMGMFKMAEGDTDFIRPLKEGIDVVMKDPGGYILFGLVAMLLACFVLPIPVVLVALGQMYRANYD